MMVPFRLFVLCAVTTRPLWAARLSNRHLIQEDPLFCGGFAGFACPDGYVCIDDPRDDCDPNNGGADCGGICQLVCDTNIPCPDGLECLFEDEKCESTIASPCQGYCTRQSCNSDKKCPIGFSCVQDSNDECDPQNSDSDCDGICVSSCEDDGTFCPEGTICVDMGGGPECFVPFDCINTECDEGFICVLDDNNDPKCILSRTATPVPTPEAGQVDTSQPIGELDTLFCGGFEGTTCPDGYVCKYDPTDDCDPDSGGARDCGGICHLICNSSDACPIGFECVIETEDCNATLGDPGNCEAYCKKQFCDESAGIKCPYGFECVDDPKDDCDPNSGGAGCGGFCEKQTCGGMTGMTCPIGFNCVDDPDDDCDPESGGADCVGICEPSCQDDNPCPEGTICIDPGGTNGQLCFIPVTCANVRCDTGLVCVPDENNSPTCVPQTPATTPALSTETSEPAPDATSAPSTSGPTTTAIFCGGIAGTPCPTGYECVDDPKDDCDPLNGGADCGGICQPQFCAGFAGIACPDGFVCISDGCDPLTTSDCGGICLEQCSEPCPQGTICTVAGNGFDCVVTLICQGIVCDEKDICVQDEKGLVRCVPKTETATPSAPVPATNEPSQAPARTTNGPTLSSTTLEPTSRTSRGDVAGLSGTSGAGSLSIALAALPLVLMLAK